MFKTSILCLFVAIFTTAIGGCAVSAPQPQSSNVPSGEELGKTVTERTKKFEEEDRDALVVASSEDGREKLTETAEGESTDGLKLEPPNSLVVVLDVDGGLERPDGTALEEIPKPDERDLVVVRYRAGTPVESLQSTVKSLIEAGWISVTLASGPTGTDEAGADEAGADEAGADEGAAERAEDEKIEEPQSE